jgi:hypothetical protein
LGEAYSRYPGDRATSPAPSAFRSLSIVPLMVRLRIRKANAPSRSAFRTSPYMIGDWRMVALYPVAPQRRKCRQQHQNCAGSECKARRRHVATATHADHCCVGRRRRSAYQSCKQYHERPHRRRALYDRTKPPLRHLSSSTVSTRSIC